MNNTTLYVQEIKLSKKSAAHLPFAKVTLVFSEQGLCRLHFGGRETLKGDGHLRRHFGERALAKASGLDAATLKQVRKALENYVQKSEPLTLPFKLDLRGTPFQKKVWQAIAQVPFGAVRSYGDIARKIHNRSASRAVGGAAGANPVPLFIPCHRILGASGDLVGFTGGLRIKQSLLAYEGVQATH